MRSAVACVLVVGVGFLAALEMPVYSQDKPKTDAAGDALPAGVIRVLAAPAFRHASAITGLAVVDGGKRLVTGSQDGAVLWDAVTGKRLKTLVKGKVRRLAASAKGDVLAVGLEGDVLTVYDLVAGKERFSLSQSNGHTYGLAFSRDGGLLASSGEGGVIRLWKINDGKPTRTIIGPEVQIWALAFHPDGKRLCCGGTDGKVREWDLATGKELRKLHDVNGGFVMGLSFSDDGTALAVSANMGRQADSPARVCVFETATLQERFRATLPEAWAHGVTLSSNGRYVAAAFANAKPRDGRVGLWDTWTGKRIRLDADEAHPVHFVHFLADGKALASAGADGAAHLWNVANGIENVMTKGPAGPIRHVAFATSGKMLASAGTGGSVQLWDTAKGTRLHLIRAHETPITSLAFSPSGKYLLAGTTQFLAPRNSASLWNAETGKYLRTFQLAAGEFTFSPDEKTLAAADDGFTVRLWDVEKGTEKHCLTHAYPVYAVAFSPNGQMLATTSADQSVRLWNADTGVCWKTLEGSYPTARRVWFSRDGSLLFAFQSKALDDVPTIVGQEGVIHVWDALTVDHLATMRITGLGREGHWLAENGRILVIPTTSGKFTALDLVTGEEIGPQVNYGGDFTKAAFSQDGQMLALGHEDGRLTLWKPPPLPQREPLPIKMDEEKLILLWQAQAGQDAKWAFHARFLLIAVPNQMLPLLRANLQPVPVLKPKQVATWISQLDSSSFKEREFAMRELDKAGDAVELTLRKALTQTTSEEAKQRIKLLLKKLDSPLGGEKLQTLRAIIILEAIGSEEAKAILRTLAGGDPGSRVTASAQAALQRIK